MKKPIRKGVRVGVAFHGRGRTRLWAKARARASDDDDDVERREDCLWYIECACACECPWRMSSRDYRECAGVYVCATIVEKKG